MSLQCLLGNVTTCADRLVILSKGSSPPQKKRKENVFFWEISPKSVYPPNHPRGFVRFGSTKGEIQVKLVTLEYARYSLTIILKIKFLGASPFTISIYGTSTQHLRLVIVNIL